MKTALPLPQNTNEIPPNNAQTRQAFLDQIASGTTPVYDAVIVGGGIVGAGAARDLALRGLKVALFEKGDYASATSSKSSKLIHGGLRYLEMFDFGLVFEALSERHWLLKTHPHLVLPLRFVLPLYKKGSGPSSGLRPGWMLRLGLWLYDTLALFRTPYFHGELSPEDVARRFPGVQKAGLKAGLYYADAMMRDDELVLECLSDAVRHGAACANYTTVKSVSKRFGEGENAFYEVSLAESLPVYFQHNAPPVRQLKVRAKQVIVCVGPWTDRMESVVAGGSGRKMKPSRGIHLVIPWSRFPIEDCMVMSAPDGRIVFVIPRKDYGAGAEAVIVGTTDAPERGDLDDVQATRAEVEYLLGQLAVFFPEAKLTAADVVTTYAGVRPLLDDGHAAEAKTSREHEIWRNDEGIVFVAGGKYTTFRPMSEEIGDFAFPGVKAGNSRAPLSRPDEYAARRQSTAGATGKAGDRTPFLDGDTTLDWLKWVLRHQMPMTLCDMVFRRTTLWARGPALMQKANVVQDVAALMAAELGWSSERQEQEIKALEKALNATMSWRQTL
jgi:glycerol-3-phosphate dehydrogenase